MAKYVLIGLEGEGRMLVVDCERMTVGEIDPDAGGAPPGEADKLRAISSARSAGLALVKGVNVAIATSQQSPSASFPYIASFPYGEAT